LLVPHLFVENFQTIDDYSNKAFFATFTRILKFIAFLVSLYLPGIYTAMAYFHPEYFPTALLEKVVNSVFETPLPLVFEVLMIFFVYEIMREAGLRIPRPSGHVVGIVGALVIGDAAVSAGIIGAPTLMVVAISSICGYGGPDVQATLTLQRLILIVAGATTGIFGITAVTVFFLINMCAKTSFGVPFMVPLAPFDKVSMRDVFVRQDWTEMGKLRAKIKNKRIVHKK
jgi:spore germination protein KA